MLKKSELKSLKTGESIALGKKLPQLYVYRKERVIGQLSLGQTENGAVVIVSAKERIVNLGKPESKYQMLECRIALLDKEDFVVGRLVQLPTGSLEDILLVTKAEVLASAKLLQNSEGYYLQITERSDD